MSKREKVKSGAPRLTAEDLQRVVGNIRRHKTEAAEAVGLAGQETKNAVDRFNLNRKALSFVVALHRLDDAKRQECLRSVVEYSDKMQFFSQLDAFNDTIEILRDIVNRAHNAQPPAPREQSQEDKNLDDAMLSD